MTIAELYANYLSVDSYLALPTGCERNLEILNGDVDYEHMYNYRHQSSDKLVGVIAWFTCDSGYFKEMVPKKFCKYYENEAQWQGETPVCETRKSKLS